MEMNGESVDVVKESSSLTLYGVDKDKFVNEIYPLRKPVVLRGLDIGPCMDRWTVDYLAEKGGEKEVKIHVSKTPNMDFINKNFLYRSLPFDELVRRASKVEQEEFFIEKNECYYLRALGDNPRKDVADIQVQFPELAKDIKFPDFYPPGKFFSSVFRIASPGTQLWTHYDFPELAKDIKFPDFYPPEKFFSSVFRIASSGTQLWTHYDGSFQNLLAKDIKFPDLYPLEKFFSSVFRVASPGTQLWTHYDISLYQRFTELQVNPLPDCKILGWSKDVADDNFRCMKFNYFGVFLVKNIVGNEEIACHKQFLHFPQCFPKLFYLGETFCRGELPELSKDIKFPDLYPPEKFFSSVFRIASPGTQLWTHYDVMDNFLVQVKGRKRVVLFSPKSANYMYLNGDKSEVLDIDNVDEERFPLFKKAERYEVFLEPGDVLFIPALWFHNVISLDFGVAVNVFWKHLDDSLYDNKDPYGNKDPTPVTRAFQIVDRALKTLEELPDDYRDFYARRLISRIEKKAVNDFPT